MQKSGDGCDLIVIEGGGHGMGMEGSRHAALEAGNDRLAEEDPQSEVMASRDSGGEHIERVRRICMAMPEVTEKLSHGEPTFFVRKKVFAMLSNNHHNDGHIAVWIPAPPGLQEALIDTSPETYYRPPYVGVRGWVGIELGRIDDEKLAEHLTDARRMIAQKKPASRRRGVVPS